MNPPESPPLESTLLVKREAQVFPIPPRTRTQGYKAAEWDTSKAWIGRLRIMHVTYASPSHATKALGPAIAPSLMSKPANIPRPANYESKPWSLCVVKLEDSTTGELFGEALIRDPETDIERVLDSSRYFVIKLWDRAAGRGAFVGFGFSDRNDAFDWNVALQDYAKLVKYELGAALADSAGSSSSSGGSAGPAMDFSLKEGQQIKINLGGKVAPGGSAAAPAPAAVGSEAAPFGFFPPPPASTATPFSFPPMSPAAAVASASRDPFGAFVTAAPPAANGKRTSGDEWEDFASFEMGGSAPAPGSESPSKSAWRSF
ncbi:hypothetical protein BC828DRAFT_82160 [Blastocladiella britannica]|nr:hypothetical protein BC828DRAFT_82160 [Blastocladiella britannica]